MQYSQGLEVGIPSLPGGEGESSSCPNSEAETSLLPQDRREFYFTLHRSPEVQCEHKIGLKNLLPGKLLWLQEP